jgi:predicted NAD/FAD-binding protein
MVWDILRFYREARELLDASDDVSIGDWLRQRHYSEAFIRDHLVPMVRAVWSAGLEDAERFPARFLVRFFPQPWFPGSGKPAALAHPARRLEVLRECPDRPLPGELRLGCPVTRVTRPSVGVVLETQSRPAERFDHVVLACHSDQALRLLGDASALERELLSCLPYQDNEAVLHTDERLMPQRRRVWSSWNVHLDDAGADGACLTYWLNSLQPLATKTNYFVTLNHTAAIDPARILRTFRYAHPVFSRGGVAAQLRHQELIDHRSTSYAGAYWRNGFHEDGVVSAQRVCQRLGAHPEEKAA